MIPEEYALDRVLEETVVKAKLAVKTQYAVQVIKVSEDGRFVDVTHNTLEWRACSNGDTVMINSFNQNVVCSPTKPWIVRDVPVEEPYVRGQWQIRTRPKVGDYGILSVFYHDISSLKEKGGFQAPNAIRVMALDSASFRPGLPNHADIAAETDTYPSDDEWEIKGNGVSVKLTSPVDGDSNSPNKMEVNVGSVNFTVTVPQNGDPTVVFAVPNGAITVNTKTAVVNADTSVTIDTPATTITGKLQVDGAVTTGSTLKTGGTITSGGDVKANTGVSLKNHVHSYIDTLPNGQESVKETQVPTP